MTLHGKNIVGGERSAKGTEVLFGFDPRNGRRLETPFHEATAEEIDHALRLAARAFPRLRAVPAEEIASLLELIGKGIEDLGERLIEQADLETALGPQRLTGERTRTVNQLRLFAAMVRDGSYVDARIDTALPDRKPVPRPDLRRMLMPIGPVAVFGASNFPLAFSVAGGDTASALAARNPVIVKAHPAHPGTSELIADVIADAVKQARLPAGIFSLLHARQPEISLALVEHPDTQAVAFTGSLRAGRAIFNAACSRPDPIPAYVEMGSINPVFLLPGALRERADAIAQGLTASINLGVGQFCTCPGLLVALEDGAFGDFRRKLADAFVSSAPATMLHAGILNGYEQSVSRVAAMPDIAVTKSSQAAESGKTQAAPVLFETTGDRWLREEALAEEIFGPGAILVRGQSEEELLHIAEALPGTLTVTVHGTPEDLKNYGRLLAVLETKCGRLIFNGYPTGVEVSPAMHHGGPYPATADPKFTSVGTAAILRFLRPICYQNFPEDALPLELQSANPRQIWRTVDGRLTRDPLA